MRQKKMVETTTIRNLALAYLENNSKWSRSYDTLCHVTNSLQEPLNKMSNLESRKNYQMELLTTRQITQSQNWNIISKTGFTEYDTCFGSPFLPPIVVDIMWPVRESFPLITEVDISCWNWWNIRIWNCSQNTYRWFDFKVKLKIETIWLTNWWTHQK